MESGSVCTGTEDDGCTRTQGYWKNHYTGGNAPNNDDPWPAAVDYGRTHALATNSSYSGYLAHGIYVFDDAKCYKVTLAGLGEIPCGTPAGSYHDQLISNSYNTEVCQIVFRQYTAASLNLAAGACASGEVFDALEYIGDMLWSGNTSCVSNNWSVPPASVVANYANWETHKDVLDCYNNGCGGIVGGECKPKYGPEHCPIGSFNATVECPPEPDDCPFYPCDGGCTQTQGYWKNHRLSKKRKQSQPWNDICVGQTEYLNETYDAPASCGVDCPLEKRYFFGTPNCTTSFYYTLETVLTTPNPKGQACLIAGKQVIAAELNSICAGACLPDGVASALAGAKAILGQYCSSLECGGVGLDSSVNKPPNSTVAGARRQLLVYSEILTDYNEGDHGPGHCSDLDNDVLFLGHEPEHTYVVEVEGDPEHKNFNIVGMVFAILGVFVALVICLLIGVYMWQNRD
jgi:hypothetical protein